MNKRIWDLYAPIYEKAMRADSKIYRFMYERIPEVIRNKDVLEIATEPGLLARHVAHAARRMVATNYSESDVTVDSSCCACVTPQSHDTALAAMRLCQIEITGEGQEPWRE